MTPATSQDVADRRPLAGILLPTRRRHFPQLLGVAAGGDENWCLGPHPIKDTEDCHAIVVLVKRDSVRQNLGLPQHSGPICVEGNSLRMEGGTGLREA